MIQPVQRGAIRAVLPAQIVQEVRFASQDSTEKPATSPLKVYKQSVVDAMRRLLQKGLLLLYNVLDGVLGKQYRPDSFTNRFYQKRYPRTQGVIVYGGSRYKPGTPEYDFARDLGKKLAQTDYHVVTGGGKGIMEAVAKGATENGGHSVGAGFALLKETDTKTHREYVMHQSPIHDRIYGPGGYEHRGAYTVVFPGDFGTNYELRLKMAELYCNSTPYPSQKKIVLVDLDGFYSKGFLKELEADIAAGKTYPGLREMLLPVKTVDDVLKVITDKTVPWTPGLPHNK